MACVLQVRDVLKGTLRWTHNLGVEEPIDIHYNHYKMDMTDSSPTTDGSSPDLPDPAHLDDAHSGSGHARPQGRTGIHGKDRRDRGNHEPRGAKMSKTSSIERAGASGAAANNARSSSATERRLFYVSSEENSEAIDSPNEGSSSAVPGNMTFKLPPNKEFELEDIRSSSQSSGAHSGNYREKKKDAPYWRQAGPNRADLSNSWSPDSDSPPDIQSPEDMEESPNPLYTMRHRPHSFNT